MSVDPPTIQVRSPRFPRLALGLMLASGLASPALLAQAGEAPAKPAPAQTAPRPVQSKEQAPSNSSALPDPPKPKRTSRRTTRHESPEEAQKVIREREASRSRKSKQTPRSIKPPSHPPATHPPAPHAAAPHPPAPHPPAPHPGPPK
jgi:hypothetical protein